MDKRKVILDVDTGADDAVEMSSAAQQRIGLGLPSHVYAMFEEAVRIAADETPQAHRCRIAELWARFNEVAQHNPHAWSNTAWTAEQIATPATNAPAMRRNACPTAMSSCPRWPSAAWAC